MALAPFGFGFDPFFGSLDRALDRAFDARGVGRSGRGEQEQGGSMALTMPGLASAMTTGGYHPMDVVELPDAYMIKADAPGFDPSDINVEVHEGVITVSGEKKQAKEQKDQQGRMLRRERVYQSFRRSFTLPEDAKDEDIDAHMEHGVLTVRVARQAPPPKPEPKRITVKGGSGGVKAIGAGGAAAGNH